MTMYQAHFGFRQPPFSIAPDPAFLYPSLGHREALAHLQYGFTDGGFVLVTGEVGTGKTTLLRSLISQTPDDLDVAFILNPRLTVRELLQTLADELGIAYDTAKTHTVKEFIDIINAALLETHNAGRSTVMIIDEAQNLSPAVLEQIRLLTNLETNERKLLRIILLGQPELAELLDRPELRQLAQRVTARYHLEPLSQDDTHAYITHRLARAGGSAKIFTRGAIRALHRLARGTPRVINVIADRALLGAYVENTHQVTARIVRRAAVEVLGRRKLRPAVVAAAGVLLGMGGVAWAYFASDLARSDPAATIATSSPADVPASPALPAAPAAAAQLPAPPPRDAAPELDTAPLVRPPGLTSSASQRIAFERVLIEWQRDTAGWERSIPCDFAATRGLQCLSLRGSWQTVAELGLPVVLELWDGNPDPYYLALLGMSDRSVELYLNGRIERTSTTALRDSWFGAFVALWPEPPGYAGAIRLGDRGATVAWARDQLGPHEPEALVGSDPELFGPNLDRAVRRFQQRHNLEPDGIIGPMTWIRLYQLQPDGARLARQGA